MVDFERIVLAYEDCNRRKAKKQSSMEFSFGLICEEIQNIVNDINNRTYVHGDSDCFVVPYPCPREVFAALYRDRIVQTFFCEEIQPALDKILLPNTTSCRHGKGTDYALHKLMEYVSSATNNGKEDASFIKLDLSGYFMSINRQRITNLMLWLIQSDLCESRYKDDLIYLAPIIYLDNPATHRILKCDLRLWETVPKRKVLDPNGVDGIAIGNITSQHGSNLYLNEVDHYCVENLNLPMYIRYVDDIVIIDRDKQKLVTALPLIENKLDSIGMKVSQKKTIIDTCYHGIKFLGKVTYPYGYQKCAKEPAGRLMNHAHKFQVGDEFMLSRLNSQVGRLKNYASYNLIHDYIKELPKDVWSYVIYDEEKQKFKWIKEVKCERPTEDWFFYSPSTGIKRSAVD